MGSGSKLEARCHGFRRVQSAQLLEQQLAGALADELAAGSGDVAGERLRAEQYPHVEASAAFVLVHGIEPFDVQRHVAAAAVETNGAVLKQFLAKVDSLRASGQWHDLPPWRVA